MKSDLLRRIGALALSLALVASLSVTALAADPPETDPPADTGTIDLDPTTMTLEVGKSGNITASIAGVSEEIKYTWKSSAEAVATVEAGTVTAVKAGTATITAEATVGDKKYSGTCTVTVTEPTPVERPTDIFLSRDELQITSKTQQPIRLTVDVDPENAVPEKIEWEIIGDENWEDKQKAVLTMEPFDEKGTQITLFPKNPGEVTLKATLIEDGKKTEITKECKVIVSGFVLSSEEVTVIQGRTHTLSIERNYGDVSSDRVQRPEWISDDASVVTVTGGMLTGMSPGTATVTCTKGDYQAKCKVTVKEDTSAMITVLNHVSAGNPIKLKDANTKVTFINVEENKDEEYRESFINALHRISREKTKSEENPDGFGLKYITNLSVATKQGIVHHGYISEADTGSGVGMTEKFYVSSGNGQVDMSELYYVPRSTFGGVAEIHYTGVATNNQNFSGIIRVDVEGMKDVTYTTGKDKPIQFQGNDFNTVCRAHTGRDLSYVTFTLPSESRGTLYYNYTGQTQYAEKVRANTQYRRTANPNLESVSFVPASGYTGTVSIDYRGVDTAGAAFSGVITITVNNLDENQGDDVYYKTAKDTPVDFRAADFNSAISGTLNYIRFNSLPTSSQGSLRLNYRSSSSSGTAVDTGARYYRTGSHSSPDGEISDITFVPNSTFTGRVTLRYTGYNTSGRYEEGTVSIDVGVDGATGSKTIQYKVNSGKAVSFNADDFNEASIAATRKSLNYIRFDDLPSSSRGTLYYNYNSSTNRGTTVRTNTSYYRNSGNRIGNLSFVSNSSYNGSVSIGYTGWNTDGEKFTGTVNITVGTPTPNVVNYSGTDSSAIRLYSSDVRSACNAVLSKELSYIQFTSLPSTSVGHLYIGYSGLNTGSQVSTGTRYYVSGNPTIDQLSFVPRGGFQGTAVLSYEGYGTDGERVQGEIRINVTAGYSSTNFTDMGRYTWANSAVNFLAQNGVVNGTSPNTFSPGQNVRRCDFVVMICRAFHFTAVNDSAGFYDVPNGTYYTSAVAAARELSIINGTGGNYFNPNGALSRQDAMVMVRNALRAANWSVGSSSTENLSMFPDGGRVSEYARDAVSTLVRLGAVNGDSNGYLRPQSTINRAEVAMILHYVMTM